MGELLERVQRTVLDPMFSALLPDFDSDEARVMLLAIGLQESKLLHRAQILAGSSLPGPARGLWQFERAGGTAGVLTHRASKPYALDICNECHVQPQAAKVWRQFEVDDLLAAAFARLLLWTDPHPLPRLGDGNGAFDYYLRNWRPGAYTRGNEAQRAALRRKWNGYYGQALGAVA